MTLPARSAWTLWPDPDPDVFGDKVYSWKFWLRINLPVSIVLFTFFVLPPVREWTGSDPWILVAGGLIQLGAFAGVLAYGYRRIHPGLRELITFGGNLAAGIALPLSSPKPLFVLWVLYLTLVFFEAYGNPKSVVALLLTLLAPSASLLAYAEGATGRDQVILAEIVAALGGAVYLLAAYVAGWTREGAYEKAARARETGAREERARIERRLDETLGTALSEIALWHEVALASGVDGAQAAPMVKAREKARQALTELRTLAEGFDRQPASMAGLAAEIQRRVGNRCREAGIRFDFSIGPFAKINLADAYHMAMIAIEAVENAVEHGAPKGITVHLSGDPLELRVEDDGAGFDPAAVPPGRGMRNFEMLSQILGARLEIDSAPEKGTRVRVSRG